MNESSWQYETISIDRAGRPDRGVLDLLEEGVRAARAGHGRRARDLLGRVIEVDEKYISAWMWLSYVADDEHERDRCLRKVISYSVPDAVPNPAWIGERPAGARPEPLAAYPAPAYAAAPAAETAPPIRTIPRLAPSMPALPDASDVYRRLRSLYLEWVTSWTLIALAYLAGITVAEVLTTLGPPRLGLVAHASLMLVLLLHAARVEGKREQAFLVALAFAPLIRLLSLSLPLSGIPILYWYLIISVPLFAALLVAAPTLGLRWRDMGLNVRRWGLQLAIGLSGLAFGAVEYFILQPDPLAPAFEWTALWWPALILLVSTGLLEEMIFRGLIQYTAAGPLGLWAVGYAAVLFAVLHAGYHSLLDIVFVLAVGLFFGWVVHRTRSLLGVTIAHGLTNIVLFLVMPFLPL